MAFLVAGTLRVAAHMADAQDSLARKGTYSLRAPRAALTICSPEVPDSTVAILEATLQALGFHSCQRREASAQGFLGELARFREQLDAQGGPVSCALVALVAPREQLRRPQLLVRELSRCEALQGHPKILLLLSSAPRAAPEPGAFLTGLRELCGRCPHWSLLQLLTEVFGLASRESCRASYCPVLRSSLRGTLFLQEAGLWDQEEGSPGAQYDLSGARAALILAVLRERPGAQRDVEALRGLCESLGFQTVLRTDPTAQDFQEELAQFRERLHTCRGPVGCVLVALMAHGGPRGQLLGADGEEVQSEALVRRLSRCRALRGCPKIFLLQACRGGHRDAGMGPAVSPRFWRWLRPSPPTPSHADVLQICADAPGGPTPESLDLADVLRVYAATEGYVAYRGERGSDFIQTLVEVVRAYPGEDLLELLAEVSRQVCALDVLGPDCSEPRKACPEVRSSLRRRLCLSRAGVAAPGCANSGSPLTHSRPVGRGASPSDLVQVSNPQPDAGS
ncbi:caspase-6 isoform X2 [Erinaceus europaeus]|uniref:Caspase-6 isoform X2 n=1 Tax=Erinaceus europaeus TaxID=9365 RepID=A0A1S3WV82_ERIEU|nr:caspase-6 isoform X2 [Erinaceus europaeus]